MSSETDLKGKVVIITGGGGLLGRSFALELSYRGAAVALADKNLKAAQKSAKEISKKTGGVVCAYPLNLPSRKSVESLEKRVEKDLGAATALINNAAFKSKNFFRKFEEYDLADWNSVLAVNLTGAAVCAQVFGKSMARRKCGTIINISSIYGVVGSDQRIYEGSKLNGRSINTPAVYAASKAGLIGLTKHLAAYWGAVGVRVNAITPGGVRSGQNKVFQKRYAAKAPMGRMAEAGEIAGAVGFLVSEKSSYITGQNIIVDGGWTAW